MLNATYKKTQLLVVALLLASSSAFAEESTMKNSEPENPLELRKIMQEMSRNMQTIVDAISREDWELVAQTAPHIANHPKPPIKERIKVIGFIGTDAPSFKNYDKQTHDTASLLTDTATLGDGDAVINEFASLQKTCLACHTAFRNTVQKHFYGENWGN
jgi:cytochrome c556